MESLGGNGAAKESVTPLKNKLKSKRLLRMLQVIKRSNAAYNI
jgi:hypothetical protein|tara:strand:+ start:532 stop:660 length:129 start_codon:yes stop_codon:yes gene_type:complete